MQRKRVRPGNLAPVRARVELRLATALGVLAAVELQVARGIDGLRSGLQPEVHEVEVVRRLVHQEPAAVALVAVPPAEVIRAVARVEHPLEVHASHLADGAGLYDLEYLRVVRRVPVIESYAHVLPCSLDGRENLLAARRVDGHWLFCDDVAAQLHSPDDIDVMRAVNRCHNHFVRLGVSNHGIEIGGLVGRYFVMAQCFQFGVGKIHACLVGVAEGDDARGRMVVLSDGRVEEAGTASRPNDGIFLLRYPHFC